MKKIRKGNLKFRGVCGGSKGPHTCPCSEFNRIEVWVGNVGMDLGGERKRSCKGDCESGKRPNCGQLPICSGLGGASLVWRGKEFDVTSVRGGPGCLKGVRSKEPAVLSVGFLKWAQGRSSLQQRGGMERSKLEKKTQDEKNREPYKARSSGKVETAGGFPQNPRRGIRGLQFNA